MRTLCLLAVIAAGCGSDSKLEDQLDPDGHGEETSATLPDEETTPTPTDTATDPTDPTDSTDPADPTGDGSTPTGPDPSDTGLTDDELCAAAAALSSILDPYQTPDDARVTYCHSANGNNYHLVDSDISSCLPHVNHAFDVFPTTGCDS